MIQQKTGVKIQVPLHRDLLDVLEKARHNHVTIVNTEYGKPFTVDGFSSFMRDAIRAAGLPLDCQPHGLRKAAGRRLAEAGCTHEADHGGPWPQVACGSGAIHEGSRSNPARDGCDVAARSANRERSLPKPPVPVWASAEKIRRYKVIVTRLALPREVPQAFSDNDLCRLPTPYWLDPMPRVSGAVTNAPTALPSPTEKVPASNGTGAVVRLRSA